MAGSLGDAWVDFAHVGLEFGTETLPFDTMAEGVDAAFPSQTVNLKAGSTSETIRITKPMTLQASGGTVTIGAP